MEQVVHGIPSVSFSRFCCMPTAWQCLGGKRGKEGYRVKCNKDKSYWPGNRLIPSCKLQTHTLKNCLEKNCVRENPETEIFGEPVMGRYVTQWPCCHKVLTRFQIFKNPALGYVTTFHGRTVVMLCLGSGCFAFRSKGLCVFFF